MNMEENRRNLPPGGAPGSGNDPAEFGRESRHLEGVLSFLKAHIVRMNDEIAERRRALYTGRQDIADEISARPDDPELAGDINQYYADDVSQLESLRILITEAEKYRLLLPAPYFGRFDFKEDGYAPEEIYVGLHTVMDPDTEELLVYDWRAPVCSIFYQGGEGRVSYRSPGGEIGGELLRKRQYKIRDSRLEYFFDCSLTIADELLMEVLGRNAAPQMRSIVTTIQGEQDRVIRNTESPLLIVTGAAGSGKTVVALHRVAYLLYHDLKTHLTSSDILILSPSDAFSRYISGVLPALQEDNVRESTLDELISGILGLPAESRAAFVDRLLGARDADRRAAYLLKTSAGFASLLERGLAYYLRRLLPFEDIWYDGRMLRDAQSLRGEFLHDRTALAPQAKLDRLRGRIFDQIHPLQRRRRKRLTDFVRGLEGHDYDYPTIGRYLSIRESGRLLGQVRRFTTLDPLAVYRSLFEKGRFARLAAAVGLPLDAQRASALSRRTLGALDLAAQGARPLPYEDAAALCYLHLLIRGGGGFETLRQVVIDEAQDLRPLQARIFSRLFPRARYTVLGDPAQSLEEEDADGEGPLFDRLPALLAISRHTRVSLTRAYRSSSEILRFAQRVGGVGAFEAFERHEQEPAQLSCADREEMDRCAAELLGGWLKEGFGTAAVLCRTGEEARALARRLARFLPVRCAEDAPVTQGALTLSAFRSKGLEFDCVAVYGAWCAPDPNGGAPGDVFADADRRLLYIACTRALHRLALLYGPPEKASAEAPGAAEKRREPGPSRG